MINTQLFRRHYAVTVLVIFFFFVVGFFISNALMRFALNRTSMLANGTPEVFFARLIDDSPIKDRAKALKHLNELSGGTIPFKQVILNSNGENISGSETFPFDWKKVRKPENDYQVVQLDQNGPPGLQNALIKLPGTPTQYLFMSPSFDHGPPGMPHPPLFLILITVCSLVVFVLVGIGFSLYLIFSSIRQKIGLADKVISELQGGNLKARIPIKRMDELGLAMSRFNKMAEEIERLVDRLHRVEKSRITLLQDLTHDLRTPVASLKNLLATIEKKSLESDQTVRSELLSISRREVDYFERLVEDLLVLAQISEPRYQASQDSISVTELIDDESQNLTAKGALFHEKTVEILHSKIAFVSGDGHLLRRLFRNALENALSFAKSRIAVSVEIQGGNSVKILIQDDGVGFSETALKGFGERKVSRMMEPTKGNRLSVGLGSVIMKTVTEIHSGKLSARNRLDGSGKVIGAELEIILPCSLHLVSDQRERD
jgi:signal transduction histidine kinase